MCLSNIAIELSLHLTEQKNSGFDVLISKVSALEKRLLDHKRKKKEKIVVNKMESAMVGTKMSPTKLKVKHTKKKTKPVKQEAPPKRLNMKEWQESQLHRESKPTPMPCRSTIMIDWLHNSLTYQDYSTGVIILMALYKYNISGISITLTDSIQDPPLHPIRITHFPMTPWKRTYF